MLLNDWGPYLVIFAGIIMPVYWILFAIFLPMKEKYVNWVSSKNWIWINTTGFMAAVVGIIASFVIFQYIGDRILNHISFFTVIVGSGIMASLLYFEGYILPGLLSTANYLVDQQSELYKFKPFERIRLIGGLVLSLGFIVWGIEWVVTGVLPVWSSVCMMIGTPLFSLVFLSGNIRLLGVVLYSAGLIGTGFAVLSNVSDQPDKLVRYFRAFIS